jgi:hypothetical protein
MKSTGIVVLFLDGVGLGVDDPAINPLAAAHMPVLAQLLGNARLLAVTGAVRTPQASLVPTDAMLGVPGRPQSATGQAALLTGVNAPVLLGEHYGPRPNRRLRELLEGETMFSRVLEAGGQVCFANAYPAGYFAAVARGKRLHGAIPYAIQAAGLPLRTADDLAAGRALSVDLSNAGWRNGLGYADMPLRSPAQAGSILANLSEQHELVFFDEWITDMLGHRGDLDAAVNLLEDIDLFLGALLQDLDLSRRTVIITSDHGNMEDCGRRHHTKNLVPTILIGAAHNQLADLIGSLVDITPALLEALDISQ